MTSRFQVKIMDVDYYIDNQPKSVIRDIKLIPDRPHILYGKDCSGKSVFAYYLAVCIASGKSHIFKDVEKGRVVIVDAENRAAKPGSFLSRLIRKYGSENEQETRDNITLFSVRGGLLEYREAWPDIVEACKGAKLLIVDNLTAIRDLSNSENDPAIVQELNRLMEITDMDCAAIMIHHAKKNGYEMRGSSAIGGRAENLYRIFKSKGVWAFKITNDRNNAPLKSFNYVIEDEGNPMPSRCEFPTDQVAINLVVPKDDIAKVPQRTLLYSKIHNLLLERKVEISKNEILKSISVNDPTVKEKAVGRELGFLKDDGLVKMIGSGNAVKYVAIFPELT